MKKYLLIRILVPLSAIILLVIVFVFYGADFYFWQGERFSRQGKYEKAVSYYQICAERYPNYSRRPEVLMRTAEVYDINLNVCEKAKKIYQKIIKNYPATQWARLASDKIRHCYDYFPLCKGNFWLEGDSETGGMNYRAEIYCVQAQKLLKKVYAGKKIITTVELTYKKDKNALREYETGGHQGRVVFRYPLEVGDTWALSSDSDELLYTLVSKTAEAEIKAGRFTDCLKVCQEKKSARGAFRYDYYAPEIGKVLVTHASLRNPKEIRISELISYKIISED